jgi:hypothetical protein
MLDQEGICFFWAKSLKFDYIDFQRTAIFTLRKGHYEIAWNTDKSVSFVFNGSYSPCSRDVVAGKMVGDP